RVGRQDNLVNAALLNPAEQRVRRQLLRTPVLKRSEPALQHVIEPPVRSGALDGSQVPWLLDHADHGRIAARVRANSAELALRQIEALPARVNLLGNGVQSFRQSEHFRAI